MTTRTLTFNVQRAVSSLGAARGSGNCSTRLTSAAPAHKSTSERRTSHQQRRLRGRNACVCSASSDEDQAMTNKLNEATNTLFPVVGRAWDETPTIQEQIARLTIEMNDAAVQQLYSLAASIRDEIHDLEDQCPLISTTKKYEEAVASENYEAAAVLRDELVVLRPKEAPKVTCKSNTVTHGVRVEVQSMYVPERSDSTQDYHFFAYRITITNESPRTVQLLNRQWKILDSNGKLELVSGPGVVGQQPILYPGGSFEYTSACPLHTPSGTMEGSYEMLVVDDPMQHTFHAKAGRFGLDEYNGEVVIAEAMMY